MTRWRYPAFLSPRMLFLCTFCILYIIFIRLSYRASLTLHIGDGTLTGHVLLAWITEALPWSITCVLAFVIPWFAMRIRLTVPFITVLLVTSFFTTMWLTSQPVSYSMDLYRYLWDGRLLIHGQNPFQYTPRDAHYAALQNWPYWSLMGWKSMPEAYPPMAQLLFGLCGFVGGATVVSYKHLLMMNWIVSVVLFYMVLVSRRLRLESSHITNHVCRSTLNTVLTSGQVLTDRDRLSFGIYLLFPPLLIEGYGAGHVDVFVIPWVLLGWLAYLRSRPGWLGTAIAVATSIKVFPIIFLIGFWHIERRRAMAKSLLCFTAVTVALFIPFLSAGTKIFSYYHQVSDLAYNSSLCYWLSKIFGDGINRHGTLLVLASELVVSAFLLFSKANKLASEIKCCLLGLTFLMTSPLVHPWYLLTLLPFAIAAFEWSTLWIAFASHLTYDEVFLDLYVEYVPTYLLYLLTWRSAWKSPSANNVGHKRGLTGSLK